MFRIATLFILSACLFACSDPAPSAVDTAIAQQETATQQPASPWTLVETVTKTGDEIVIPYRKYQHPNGLTVLLHDDDSDPLVHVNITYHVGSAREEPQRSGFAHFFELEGFDDGGDLLHGERSPKEQLTRAGSGWTPGRRPTQARKRAVIG